MRLSFVSIEAAAAAATAVLPLGIRVFFFSVLYSLMCFCAYTLLNFITISKPLLLLRRPVSIGFGYCYCC